MKKISDNIKLTPKNSYKIAKCTLSCLKQGETSYPPIRLQIELSGKCNLGCVMCPQSLVNNGNNKKDIIPFERYKLIFDQIKPIIVDFTGQGETMLNPDLEKIARYTNAKGAIFGFNTNFTLMTREKFKKLYDAGLCYMGFSLDSVNKKTYEQIRKRAIFEAVIHNFKEALRIDKRGVLTIGIVITEKNIDELNEIIEFCHREFLNVPFVFSPPLSYGLNEMEEYFEEIGFFTSRKQEFIEKIIRAIKFAKQLRLNSTILSLNDCLMYFKTNGHHNSDKVCYMPYLNIMIYANGEVAPCCYMPFKPKFLGNIFKQNFKEVWNNTNYQNFRLKLKNNRQSIKECTLCRFSSSQNTIISPIRKILFIK